LHLLSCRREIAKRAGPSGRQTVTGPAPYRRTGPQIRSVLRRPARAHTRLPKRAPASGPGRGKGGNMTSKSSGLVGFAVLCASAVHGHAQILMQRDVSVRMGLAIAEAALTECEKTGNSVSVAVVDRAGRLRVFLQADNAAPHNIELARRKAYTARTFGRTSAE